jgi:hypothetical protein
MASQNYHYGTLLWEIQYQDYMIYYTGRFQRLIVWSFTIFIINACLNLFNKALEILLVRLLLYMSPGEFNKPIYNDYLS